MSSSVTSQTIEQAHTDNEVAIRVSNLSKVYQIYDRPEDRLKQSIFPRLQRVIGRQPENYYRQFWALKDVSFEVKKGETIGIIGRNGSGKSTLLQIICGTLSPSSGAVETNGRVAALLELGYGFNPEFTGRENVYMNAATLGLSRDEIDAKFDDICAFADIGDFVEQPVKMYSSGMVLRLAFAVAINVDSQILVVDEALAVGDELFQRKCFSRIQAIKERGAAILFVSHSGPQIVELCDRGILIDTGEKLAESSPKFISSRYQKLLYAQPDKRKKIRQQILDENDLSINSQAPMESSSSSRKQSSEHQLDYQEEFFDPSLKPDSMVEFESHGAEIKTVNIYTVAGEKVNALIRGKSYIYSYQIQFSQAAQNVRFGMVIRTTNGLLLGGGFSVSSTADSIPYVGAGKSISVKFSFNCCFNPDTYFMNVAAFGFHNNEEIVLCRVVDALAFRVMPENNDNATGAVWFLNNPVLVEEKEIEDDN